MRFRILIVAAMLSCVQWTTFVPEADAGLLRDWFNRCRLRKQPVAAPTQCCSPQVASYAGLQPGQCMQTCQQTCSRVVVNYVPCTSYRTTYERVPVTQYRPQTRTDPCTGCTVTCMRPCTSYTYRTRRVPYTTYRPVYRTQTYQVPVTTITNDCNTCATPSPCANGLCGTTVGYPSTYTPTGAYAPATTTVPGVISTNGTYNTQPTYNGPSTLPGTTVTPLPTPADTTPSINPQNSNRSVIEGSSTGVPFQQQNTVNWALTSAKHPANRDWSTVPINDAPVARAQVANSRPTASPVTRKWQYSPVKQASYVSVSNEIPESDQKQAVTTFRGEFAPVAEASSADEKLVNEGWETVNW